MKIWYSPSYVGAAHAFDTTRKSKMIADSLVEMPIVGVQLVEPQPLSFDEVARVHDATYVRAVETGEPRHLAESQGFGWDPGLWQMVCASNGGAVAAALEAMRSGAAGSLSSGLHHARRDRGAGFCTFNGLVIAAREALDAGAGSVLIIDLDAHCGGGTASLIADEPRVWQMDVSTNTFDSYASTPRARLEIVSRAGDYLGTVERSLEIVAEAWPPFRLCLYNAGVDPVEGCDVGGMAGITEGMLRRRDQLVFDWCREQGIAVAFVLAGGYLGPRLDQATLVRLHRQTIAAAASPAQADREPHAST